MSKPTLITLYAKAKQLADAEFNAKENLTDLGVSYTKGYAWTLIYAASFVEILKEMAEEEDISLSQADIFELLDNAVRSYSNPEMDEGANHALGEIKNIIRHVLQMTANEN